jgi:hypothetical protein
VFTRRQDDVFVVERLQANIDCQWEFPRAHQFPKLVERPRWQTVMEGDQQTPTSPLRRREGRHVHPGIMLPDPDCRRTAERTTRGTGTSARSTNCQECLRESRDCLCDLGVAGYFEGGSMTS